MSFLSFFRGRPAPGASKRHAAHGGVASISAATQSQARHEIVRLALRDVLTRHDIPAEWIGFEVLWTARPKSPPKAPRSPAMHLQLLIRHVEPELLSQALAFERALVKRLHLFDPKASAWLGRVSWQFDLPASTPCPPWHGLAADGTRPSSAASAQPRPAGADDPQLEAQMQELRRLFAIGNSQYARLAAEGRHHGFEETRPADLR